MSIILFAGIKRSADKTLIYLHLRSSTT